MAEPAKRPVTMVDLLVTSLAQTDALAKLLIEKGLTRGKSSCRRFRKNGRRIRTCSIQFDNEPGGSQCVHLCWSFQSYY